MAGAGTFTRESRVRQANLRDAVFLFQIPAHNGLRRILLPVRKPCEDQQALDARFCDTLRNGFSPMPMPRIIHLPPWRRSDSMCVVLELHFSTPPFHEFVGISQRLKELAPRPMAAKFQVGIGEPS